jgi:DNA primase
LAIADPLYGLEKLHQHDEAQNDKPILLVEGEKTADKAQDLFPGHNVLSWNGGCGAVQKSDWSVLKDKDITIWPDHDKAGINAANKIASILKDQHQTTPKIVDLDPTLHPKWDLADDIPKHLDIHKSVHEAKEFDQTNTLEKDTGSNSKGKKELSQELVEKISKKLGVELNTGFEHKEVALINTLYNSYRELNPEMHQTDMMIKAVSVGIHMHDFHLNHGKSEAFHGDDMTKAYKVGLTAYHAIDHFGASRPAYDHACKLHAEGHINESLHHDLTHHEHYKDQTMDHHMETVNLHLKIQEHHIEHAHQQHLEMQMQQHSIGSIDR